MMVTVEGIRLSQGRLKIFIILGGGFPSGNDFRTNALKGATKGYSDAKARYVPRLSALPGLKMSPSWSCIKC
jgi:hypothetical protein